MRDVNTIILKDPRGRYVPLQTEVMNHWDDGSVRWVLLDFIAKGVKSGDKFEFGWGKPRKEVLPKTPATARQNGTRTVVQTGCLKITFVGKPKVLLDSIRLSKSPCYLQAFWYDCIQVDRNGQSELCFPEGEDLQVTTCGPNRATTDLHGHLTLYETTQRLGHFELRMSTYAGLPYVRFLYRIYLDAPETPNIHEIQFMSKLMIAEGSSEVAWDAEGKHALKSDESLNLVQPAADDFTVMVYRGDEVAHADRSEGWMAQGIEGLTHLVAVRHFWQQHPKDIMASSTALSIGLFCPVISEEPFYQPQEGEAKRHEIFLAFMPEALDPKKCSAIAAAFQNPPRLFNAEYFCKVGGFGYAHPHNDEDFPELTDFMREKYGEAEPEQFYEFGIRNFGDRRYSQTGNKKPGGDADELWCNNYYDSMHGFLSEYLMTGDRRWFDHLEATARHVMDIDTCHASAEHPEWVGSWRAYSCPNHSQGGPWSAMQRTKGMMAYWRLTGDVDARDNALGVADWLIRTDWGLDSRSSRDFAGVLMAATMAYDETHDTKYLNLTRRLAHAAISRMDLRRGCFSEVHGNHSYRGNVPWMDAQLAEPLFYYYQQSTDVLAADAVVGLAESIITENMSPDVPGDIYGYSHNPHFGKTSNYHILIAPALCYAYELTGDRQFLCCARASYKQTIREGTVNHIQNCYWNTPTLLYYLAGEM